MLDLLRMDVLDAERELKDEVGEIWMMEYVKNAWRERVKYEAGASNDFLRAQSIGTVLASGERERLGMMRNLQNLHWVAVAVDSKESRILYGDPFHSERDPEIEKAVGWWTTFHTGRKFSWGTLDILNQKDGFNCGILSHNGEAPGSHESVSGTAGH
jgi:hypothetical protein